MKNLNQNLPSPCYVCEEELLEKNLKLLKYIQDEAEVTILLALKGFALRSTFDICKKYLKGCCASGLNEARLAYNEFGGEVHTYSPAFKPNEFEDIVKISNHIVFNSFAQFELYKDKTTKSNSLGLRINPEYSSVE
ncbi:MAG: carboxynorspermidine decarboxylase, partial [Arcobacteraceae bacterium]|nr:carboxynorspermidine decarboxylase [Arcobacteraceae bacterium]